MKLALASDLHLEFAQIELKNPGVDALVLSGDIMVACQLDPFRTDSNAIRQRERFTEFFEQVSKEFPLVLYIMGNHEHYHGDFRSTAKLIRDFLIRNSFDNVVLLDNETVTLGHFTVFGATLWSDFNKEDPVSMISANNYMNDYHVVKDSAKASTAMYGGWERGVNSNLMPEDTLREHKNTLIKIRQEAEKGNDMIVIGHHSPSFQSIHADYKEDKYMNGAYHSQLEHLMEQFPNIKVWTHGHTHYPFDYEVFSTRIVCNPRGYAGYEAASANFQLKVIEC